MIPRSKLNIQGWLDPVVVDNHILMIILRVPYIIIRMISNLNIIIPKQLSNDKSHLHVRKTGRSSLAEISNSSKERRLTFVQYNLEDQERTD
jgi:hypothetical protein